MQIKRILAGMVIASLVGLALMGCSGGNNSKVQEQTASPQGQPEKTTAPSPSSSPEADNPYADAVKLKWLGFNEQGYLPKDGTRIQKELEDRFNVEIENVKVDIYNLEQVNVYFASGESADVIMHNASRIDQMVDSGVIRDVPFEWLEQYAPAIVQALDGVAPTELWRDKGSYGGKFYAVPSLSKTWLTPRVLSLRKDWMEAVGVSEIPETLDQLEDLLLKLRNGDPDGNGLKDTYPLHKFTPAAAVDLINPYVFGAFGVTLWNWHEVDGQLVHASIHPGFKEGLKVLNRWYEEEIYDPEVVIDDRAKMSAKYESGKVGGFFEQDSWLDPGFQDGPVYRMLKNNPQAETVIIPPVRGPDGVAGTSTISTNPVGEAYVYFGASATDEQVIRVLQMLNEIYTDEKLFALTEFGYEGEHYSIDEQGNYLMIDDQFSQQAVTDRGARRYNMRAFVSDLSLKFLLQPSRFQVYEQIKDYPRVPAPVYQPGILLEVDMALGDIMTEYFWQALVGKVNVDDSWDAYVQHWLDAGGKQATETANRDYAEMMAKLNR